MNDRLLRNIRVDVLGGLGLLVVTAGGYLLGVEPEMRARAERQQQAAALEASRRDAMIAESDAKGNVITRARLLKQVDELPFQLESAGTLNQRMVELTKLAESLHVNVAQISPGKLEARELFTVTPIKISGTCGYGTFTKFLAELKVVFPDTEVAEFKLTGTPHSQKPESSFTMSCVWYAAPVATTGVNDATGR